MPTNLIMYWFILKEYLEQNSALLISLLFFNVWPYIGLMFGSIIKKNKEDRVRNNIHKKKGYKITSLFLLFQHVLFSNNFQNDRTYPANFSEENVKKVCELYRWHCSWIFYVLCGNIVFLCGMHKFSRKSALSGVLWCRILLGFVPSYLMFKKELLVTQILSLLVSFLCKKCDLSQQQFLLFDRIVINKWPQSTSVIQA